MATQLILIQDVCSQQDLESTFLEQLEQHGLITTSLINNERYIDEEALSAIHRWSSLYYDLDINFEGLETINHLLNRVAQLQQQVLQLMPYQSFVQQQFKEIQEADES